MPAAAIRPVRMLANSVRLKAKATSPSPRFQSPVGALLECDRHGHLDLVPRAEPSFVDQLVPDRPLAATRERRRPHRFVLRERLLGEERARQVEVAARPGRLPAERAQMADRQRDLLRRERVAERRHVTVEPADGPAFVHDGLPIRIGLRGGERAVAEVRKGDVEPDDRPGRPAAIRAVAGGARGAVHVLAGPARRKRSGYRVGSLRQRQRASEQLADGQVQNQLRHGQAA